MRTDSANGEDVRINDVVCFSSRIKNLLKRNGLFTRYALQEYASKHRLTDMNGLGPVGAERIMEYLDNADHAEKIDRSKNDKTLAAPVRTIRRKQKDRNRVEAAGVDERDVPIEQVAGLTPRIKNALMRNGIFRLSDLLKCRLSDIKGLGEKSQEDIKAFLRTVKAKENGVQAPVEIADVFCGDKFGLFREFCRINNMSYMSELEAFDFSSLLFGRWVWSPKNRDYC